MPISPHLSKWVSHFCHSREEQVKGGRERQNFTSNILEKTGAET